MSNLSTEICSAIGNYPSCTSLAPLPAVLDNNSNCYMELQLCPETLREDLRDWQATIIVGFVGFTILCYDHLITLKDEVELVWLQPKGRVSYIFLLNRYLIPLSFVANLFAYNFTHWTNETCYPMAIFEGAMTMIGVNLSAFLMFERVRAICKGHNQSWIIALTAFVLAIEVAGNAYLLANATVSPRILQTSGCSMVFNSDTTRWNPASAWLPLLYDTIVFLITLNRTFDVRRSVALGHDGPKRFGIMETVFHEGIVYYSVICSVNLVLTIMIRVAPAGIQNIAAQLELLLTVAMISRITLHLKSEQNGNIHGAEPLTRTHSPIVFGPGPEPQSHLSSRIVFHDRAPETDPINSQSVQVVAEGVPSKNRWTKELRGMHSDVDFSENHVRPQPTRWWTMLTTPTRALSANPGDRTIRESTSMPRLPVVEVYSVDTGAEEWIENVEYH